MNRDFLRLCNVMGVFGYLLYQFSCTLMGSGLNYY